MTLPFRDRYDAGQQLAAKLKSEVGSRDALVLALPRGGVPIGYEIAEALGVPLDVFLVRKLGVPGHEELAMGAIAMGGLRVLNDDLARELAIPAATVDAVEARERQEMARRERLYRGNRPTPNLRGKTVILVDDGLATGSTMVAAARAVRQLRPARVVAAVPVASADVCAGMRQLVDEMICLETPEPFAAVGLWYEDFSPTSDEEVQELLRRAQGQAARKESSDRVDRDDEAASHPDRNAA